jgi:hypothetical protein
MEFQSVRLLLELPGELVVMEVPKIRKEKWPANLDAKQLPFPPPYDTSGDAIKLWSPNLEQPLDE